MRYHRRHTSKREQEEYKQWLEDHQKTIRTRTVGEQRMQDKKYWEQKAKEQKQLQSLRNSTRDIPSVGVGSQETKKDPRADMTPEQRAEYDRREQEAQKLIDEKKNRVAPAYNKGGYQYYSDGMIDSMLGGKHRRR